MGVARRGEAVTKRKQRKKFCNIEAIEVDNLENIDFDDEDIHFLILEMLDQLVVIEALNAIVYDNGREVECSEVSRSWYVFFTVCACLFYPSFLVRRRVIMRVDMDFWRRLGDPTFKDHFRMRREVFEVPALFPIRIFRIFLLFFLVVL